MIANIDGPSPVPEIKLYEDDHVAPHVTRGTRSLSIRSLWGTESRRRHAVRNVGVAELHCEAVAAEIDFVCA
jgi:hypothetical protein